MYEYSGMRDHISLLNGIDVSKEITASVFTVNR
jgi:hypothetical protein